MPDWRSTGEIGQGRTGDWVNGDPIVEHYKTPVFRWMTGPEAAVEAGSSRNFRVWDST